MKKFIKITDKILEEENFKSYLVDEVRTNLTIETSECELGMMYAIADCESPIEQLLAIELERINLKNMYVLNPFIDVVEIEKQQEIKCGKKTYRVDFLIPVVYKNQENKMFVVECDGHEFHQKTKEQVENDNKRQRDLQKEGYEIIRFSGTEIWHKPYQCACEIKNIIMSKCKYVKGEENDR